MTLAGLWSDGAGDQKAIAGRVELIKRQIQDAKHDPEQRTGAQLLRRALEEPLRLIALNAGVDDHLVHVGDCLRLEARRAKFAGIQHGSPDRAPGYSGTAAIWAAKAWNDSCIGRPTVQLSPSEPAAASLLVLESGARFPFDATGYRGALDTAIVVQQRGESQAGFEQRIRRTARQFTLAGVPLATVALVVDQRAGQSHPERRSTALTLLAQLAHDDTQLLLIADGAKRPLRHELIILVGTLIERDGVKRPIAVDFDARHMAELRAAGAPAATRESRNRSEASHAHAG